jgi:two-component system NtrC family sensor kinase
MHHITGEMRRRKGKSEPAYVDAEQTASPFAGIDRPHGPEYFAQLSWKIKRRLLYAYVTPLVLLSAYFLLQYQKTLREGIDIHLASIAENQRNTVDLYLQERTANLRGILGSIGRFDPPPAEAMEEALVQLRSDSVAFVDVGLFRPDGTLVSYAGPHSYLQGRDYRDEDWFKRVMGAEDRTFISDVYLGFRGQPHFIIAVTREVDARPWTLRASVDPREFSEFVGRSHLIAEADAFIVNHDGRAQTHSSKLGRDQRVPRESLGLAKTFVDEMELDGLTCVAAVAPLRKSDWSLVVMVPEDQAYSPLRRANALVVAFMLLTLAVVVAVAHRSTQRLVGLLEATDASRENLQRHLFNAAKLASVGEMAAGVAHEINNPLAVVYEEAGMMLDTLDPELGREVDMDEFRERLTAISQATIRGRNITRQLLAFSRQDEPEPVDLDVNELLQDALAIKKTEFSVCNIDVTTKLAADLPTVSADRNQVEQVVLNLLNNARDAIGRRGRIIIETRSEDGSVRIQITDNGCGMPQELMERIFFPFFTTKGVGKGTGLGLSISYGIVKGLGGNIEVESRMGHGTSFIITLPVRHPSSKL